ncbi:MAG TPA: hypothetical protein VMM12_10280 [Longimicrobiales bacterium]|nr:hypothetical protein [Longimicrobiales bacterium]
MSRPSPRLPYTVIAAAALAACQAPIEPPSGNVVHASSIEARVGAADPFTLSPGQEATSSSLDLTIRFVDVATDSRCPIDVDCVWEGDAEVVIHLGEPGEERLVSLHTPGERIGLGTVDLSSGHRLELIELLPDDRSDRPIVQKEYRATFRLVALAGD